MDMHALGIIDMQRCFMPASEGKRLNKPGFGELPVLGGERIIPNINRLIAAFALYQHRIFTTQDWHPTNTAHFSDTPNFVTTWPRHGIGYTPGADFHPDVILPAGVAKFHKGMEQLKRGEDDTSYSGYYAEREISEEGLPEWFKKEKVTRATIGGLVLEHCVGDSGYDFQTKCDLEVTLVIDATKEIDPTRAEAMLEKLQDAGVRIKTTDEVIAELILEAEQAAEMQKTH